MSNVANIPSLRTIDASHQAMEEAKSVMASGLSSFARMRKNQVVFSRAKGAHLWDIEGNPYIDVVSAHGPVLLGHSPEVVVEAIKQHVDTGLIMGGPHLAETTLARKVLEILPWANKIAYANTGTEAVQLALRVAKVATGRNKIVKFDGHYHGWLDPVYVNGPGVASQIAQGNASAHLSAAQSPTEHSVSALPAPTDVIVTEWNNIDRFKELIADVGSDVAAVICEPYATNFGTFAPDEHFLHEMMRIAREAGALVLFDEVVTGFRLAPGGAAEKLGVQPDLGIYAKAFGSGLPISLIAGTEEAMKPIVEGKVMTSGTYSGSVLPVQASIATLTEIQRRGSGLYSQLEERTRQLADGLERVGHKLGVAVTVNQIGPLAQILVGDIADRSSIAGVNTSDTKFLAEVCELMITLGVYISRKGLMYVNAAHTREDIDQVVNTFEMAVAQLQK